MVYFSLVVRGPWFSGSSFAVIKFGMIQNIRLGTSSCASFACLSSPASSVASADLDEASVELHFGAEVSSFPWARPLKVRRNRTTRNHAVCKRTRRDFKPRGIIYGTGEL